jgi:hypothetical protein
MHYFCTDRDAALDRWLAEKDADFSDPPRPHQDNATVQEMCIRFLATKKCMGERAS